MEELQRKIDAVMRLATANTIEERNAALEEVRRLMEAPSAPAPAKEAESIIQDILLELGAPDHLLGYPMVIESVKLGLESRQYIENITDKLYPKVAETFDSTIIRVERAIRQFIEVTWLRGELDVQYKLFGNTIRPDKAKPTNCQFIARLVTITQQRLKMV